MRAIITISVSCGMERDWELFERRRTSSVENRMKAARYFSKKGLQVAFGGEPFIISWHTLKNFEDMLKRMKSFGINRYNVYNLHLPAFVAKRLVEVDGIDIDAVWKGNQDSGWKKVLKELIELAKKHNVILGCPDFVNSGSYTEASNTCCGVDVKNPTTFNAITWKRLLLKGKDKQEVFEESWDGIGDKELGRQLLFGSHDKMYSMADVEGKKGFGL